MSIKNKLMQKLKEKNLLWSYDKNVLINDDFLIENVLKYLDVEDILNLFKIFPEERIIDVYKRKILQDFRFKKLCYYLEKVIFNKKIKFKKESRLDKLKSFIR